jgi:hypothetical protein
VPTDAAPTHLPVVYRLPVGAVSVAPTREAIVDNAANRAVLSSLLHEWQAAQFTDFTTAMLDESTSAWTLNQIRNDLLDRKLDKHFQQWCERTRPAFITDGRLPGRYTNSITQMFQYAMPDR